MISFAILELFNIHSKEFLSNVSIINELITIANDII
jgi:hypothetical protein